MFALHYICSGDALIIGEENGNDQFPGSQAHWGGDAQILSFSGCDFIKALYSSSLFHSSPVSSASSLPEPGSPP